MGICAAMRRTPLNIVQDLWSTETKQDMRKSTWAPEDLSKRVEICADNILICREIEAFFRGAVWNSQLCGRLRGVHPARFSNAPNGRSRQARSWRWAPNGVAHFLDLVEEG